MISFDNMAILVLLVYTYAYFAASSSTNIHERRTLHASVKKECHMIEQFQSTSCDFFEHCHHLCCCSSDEIYLCHLARFWRKSL